MIVAAFAAAFGLAVLALVFLGAGQDGTVLAMRLTGRLAFAFFLLAYTGSSLTLLFGRVFAPVKHLGRELGLAFAAVMSVHFSLLAWLCWIGHAPARSVFIIFGIGAFWVLALVLMSIERLRRAVGAKGWWLVRVVGMNYIAAVFLLDFTRNPFQGGIKHLVSYLPFAALAAAAILCRFSADALRLAKHWRRAPL